MPLTTDKHKLRYPVNTDHAKLFEWLEQLAKDVDNRVAHRALPYHGKPYVESGGAVTKPGGLNVAIGAGVAMINGYSFAFAASGNLTLAASSSTRVWLTQTLDAAGFHVGHSWTLRTDATTPANSVLVAVVDSDATTATTALASFRGVIAPGKEIIAATATASSTGVGNKLTLPNVVGDGHTRMKFEAFALYMTVTDTTGVVQMRIQDSGGYLGGSAAGNAGGAIDGTVTAAGVRIPVAINGIRIQYAGYRTFTMNLTGPTNCHVFADTNVPMYMRAIWDI